SIMFDRVPRSTYSNLLHGRPLPAELQVSTGPRTALLVRVAKSAWFYSWTIPRASFTHAADMYRVIGADQKEYGPVSADQLRGWVTQGRANARTLVQAEGTVGWKPVVDFPELAAALAQAGPPAYPVSALPPVATDNNMAMASLILGCVSLVCCQPLAIVGIILGILALNQTKTDPNK